MSSTEQNAITNKRLHISGITPSITEKDISSRFGSFGQVKTVDGVGKLDGNGQPRKFAYVSLETTQPKFTRCLNLLNGSTWKGAKLRIGEAKPNFEERLGQERGELTLKRPGESNLSDTQPKKKAKKKSKKLPRGIQGREAQDMKPTTLQNIQHRKGWKRTALDHLVYPIRMRPTHPLPSLRTSRPVSKVKTTSKKKVSSKRKERPPITRARKTVIDPTRYGAIHITAASGLLGGEVVGYEAPPNSKHMPISEGEESGASGSEDSGDAVIVQDDGDDTSPQHLPLEKLSLSRVSPINLPESQTIHPLVDTDADVSAQIKAERSRDLAILDDLLGGKDLLAWEPDSDLEELARIETEKDKSTTDEDSDEESSDTSSDDKPDTNEPAPPPVPEVVETQTEQPKGTSSIVHIKSLKDMFAPREEEAGFSIFGNLEMDLELEEDFDNTPLTHSKPYSVAVQHREPTPPIPVSNDVMFDPTAPFFFTLPRDNNGQLELPGGSWAGRKGGKPKDLIDALNEDTSDGFWRTETEDEIRQRWDRVKGDLTREYKRRHREAVKKKRKGPVVRNRGPHDTEEI